MPVRKSIWKTGNFLQKTLQSFKSIIFGDYQKLPRKPHLCPFSFSSHSSKYSQTDELYTMFSCELDSDLEQAKKRNNNMVQDSSCESSDQIQEKHKHVDKVKQEKKPKASSLTKRQMQYSSQKIKRGGDALARKMKELDMMDSGDMEHVLDVEEALHFYSRLKSPVYLDIVDNFFMDMYYEFSLPQPSSSINSSRRRPKSFRL